MTKLESRIDFKSLSIYVCPITTVQFSKYFRYFVSFLASVVDASLLTSCCITNRTFKNRRFESSSCWSLKLEVWFSCITSRVQMKFIRQYRSFTIIDFIRHSCCQPHSLVHLFTLKVKPQVTLFVQSLRSPLSLISEQSVVSSLLNMRLQ